MSPIDRPLRDALMEYVAPGSSTALKAAEWVQDWRKTKKLKSKKRNSEGEQMVKVEKPSKVLSQDSSNMAFTRKRLAKLASRVIKKRKPSKPTKAKDVTRDAVVIGKNKRRKGVKKAPSFQKKVMNAIMAKEPKGHMQVIHYDRIKQFPDTILPAPRSPQKIQAFNSNWSGVLFAHYIANYYASRLFNNRGVAGLGVLPADMIGADGSFDPTNLKLNIIKNNCIISLKNNTHRTYYVKVFFVTPKTIQSESLPISQWDASLAARAAGDEYEASVTYGTTTPIVAVNKEKLYQDPRQHADFNKLYACDVRTVVMEPGEVTTLFKSMFTGMMDFKKYYRNGVFQNIAPCNTYCFTVTYTDLAMTLPTGNYIPAYYASARATDDAQGHYISAEIKLDCVFAMPEQAGFINPGSFVAGNRQLLNERQEKYAFDHYSFNNLLGDTDMQVRVDAEQPASEVPRI